MCLSRGLMIAEGALSKVEKLFRTNPLPLLLACEVSEEGEAGQDFVRGLFLGGLVLKGVNLFLQRFFYPVLGTLTQ